MVTDWGEEADEDDEEDQDQSEGIKIDEGFGYQVL